MTQEKSLKICLNCERDESSVPLIEVHYRGGSDWICSQCFPVLIHKPDRLAGRLDGAEDLAPSPHEHD